jgi:hypothetical protein
MSAFRVVALCAAIAGAALAVEAVTPGRSDAISDDGFSDADLLAVEPMPESLEYPAKWDEVERRVRDFMLQKNVATKSTDAIAHGIRVIHDNLGVDIDDDWGWAELSVRREVLCWHLPFDHPFRGGEFCDSVTPPPAMFVPGYSDAPPSLEDIAEVGTVYPPG